MVSIFSSESFDRASAFGKPSSSSTGSAIFSKLVSVSSFLSEARHNASMSSRLVVACEVDDLRVEEREKRECVYGRKMGGEGWEMGWKESSGTRRHHFKREPFAESIDDCQ